MIDDAKIVNPPPPPRGRRAAGSSRSRAPKFSKPSMVLPFIPVLILAAIVLGSFWWWFWWRIEPGNGEIAILTKKTGKDLPTEEIIAVTDEYKGVQLAVS